MYSVRKPLAASLAERPTPTEHYLTIIHRMRALSVDDKELASLLEELKPHLPKAGVIGLAN